ncbi:MAG: hypothetical protein U0105_26020 [Candidatus Obscuribacterales bacterium]
MGTGDSDSGWGRLTSDLRGYDLEIEPDSEHAEFMGLDGLSMVKIVSRHHAPEMVHEGTHAEHLRRYTMLDALSGLHAQKCNVAFLVCGQQTRCDLYLGMMPPGITADAESSDSEDLTAITLRSLLHNIFGSSIEVARESVSVQVVSNIIAPLATLVGCVTGMPSESETERGRAIERICRLFYGYSFGLFVVAAPIPPRLVNEEENLVLEQISKAETAHDPDRKRRIKYCLELLQAYQAQLRQSIAVEDGRWLSIILQLTRRSLCALEMN